MLSGGLLQKNQGVPKMLGQKSTLTASIHSGNKTRNCRVCISMERLDDELVRAYRGGDSGAFSALIGQHIGPIYAFARRVTGQRADAEDVTQETFAKAWRMLGSYRPGGTFRAWLFRIARNAAVDLLRRKRDLPLSRFDDEHGHNRLAESVPDPDTLPAARIEKQENEALLERGLLWLPAADREVLLMHYMEELPFRRIGALLGASPDTVKSRHRRAVAKLRTYFAAHA